MKNNTNIYDIDGELIRKAGDNHKFTVSEARKQIEIYKNKLENIDENDPKYKVYTTYIANLSKYILNLYSTMTPDQINEELNILKTEENVNKQVEKAINDLKKEIENEETEQINQPVTSVSDAGENKEEQEQPKTQDDFIIGRDEQSEPTVMDEYVDFEEIK